MPSLAKTERCQIDLSPTQTQEVRRILTSVLATPQAWIFGSRATGRARPYSDLDILIATSEQLTWRHRADLLDAFEASDLPFRVDIVEESRLAPGMVERVMAERLPL
jgi:uncharacterized protein